MGTIEYVGETWIPKSRWCVHKSRGGQFYKRQDVFMNIVASFPNKKLSFKYQCDLQTEYGFINDREKLIKNHTNKKPISL